MKKVNVKLKELSFKKSTIANFYIRSQHGGGGRITLGGPDCTNTNLCPSHSRCPPGINCF